MADYIPHDEAAIIAAELIESFHPHLKSVKIAHLLRIMPIPKKPKAPRQGKKIVLAKTSKVSSKMLALAADNYGFVIEYGSLYWDQMDDKMKRALVDHELGHCGHDGDGIYLVNHDIEDFGFMLERHGLWKRDVAEFAATVIKTVTDQVNAANEAVEQEAAAEHEAAAQNVDVADVIDECQAEGAYSV